MSKREPQKHQHDWEEFWGTIWYNLMHVLGLLTVLGIVGGIIWALVAPSPERPIAVTQPSLVETTPGREAMQINFNRELFANTKPCATKSKKLSDVSNCTLFGLRLGMLLDVAKHVLDRSGYFLGPARFIPKCTDKSKTDCADGYIYQDRDGFSVTVNFTAPPDSPLQADRIQVIFGPGGIPYFDLESLPSVFLKIFGPPDESREAHHTWGRLDKDGASITAYPYREKYWVILERGR